MHEGRVILTSERIQLTIQRLCHHILENHQDTTNLCIVGIQERGVLLAEKIRQQLVNMLGEQHFKYGMLDITFYRDDFRRRDTPIRASATDISFTVENRDIILIDDVLYTGRTVHAAIAAIQDLGRPRKIEMLCMVDRRFNRHFPIKADYLGIAVDAVEEAYVRVRWKEKDGEDAVLLFAGKDQ
ncbi:MAG: bifunctional pyr operon transcriptional regulator/uracil phosphoribosyltransferase PyrR [Saprospiraceae bacterium]